ncbi:DUF4166 domain-containing protein [Microbacterium sp. CIAB417]|uniref:DUF4166 domain-containing protein n=1 Tax=Microbacterium sp. CIAB417 TaxID=2860287 RepID=UPI001FAD0D05|nr:DUF4166 domain-containing protein [Microbacterium sp. CIAB417]
MRHPSTSPYARALGSRMPLLDASTRRYFSAIPEGRVGVGEGVFERVGTRRGWLAPLLRPLQRRGILVAGWYEDVPFRIENRTVAGRAIAERTLRLPGGDWVMRDAVALKPHGRLVDELGEPPLLAASFDVGTDGGSLRLTSRAMGLRVGRMRPRLSGRLAPRIRLREGADEASGRQRVELTVDVPLIGRIYEYAGTFTYRIEEES